MALVRCNNCGSMVDPNKPKCSSCGAIFNMSDIVEEKKKESSERAKTYQQTTSTPIVKQRTYDWKFIIIVMVLASIFYIIADFSSTLLKEQYFKNRIENTLNNFK